MSDGTTRDWEQFCLKELGELSTSSVDKKVEPSEKWVSLINYMDVYRNDFILPNMDLMRVTASVSEIDRFQIRKDDVLFTPSSETPDDIGHAALVLDDMPCTLHSYHTVRFRQFSPRQIEGRYAGHIFKQRAFRKYVARHSTGSTRYTLSLAEFSQAKISVPPVMEQRWIAQILDTLDIQIRQTKALIVKLERIKQGLLTDFLTRGIDQNGRLRPTFGQAPHCYKDSLLGTIPKEWDVRPLIEAVSHKKNAIVDGPFGSNLKTVHYISSGIPVIQSGFVTSGAFQADSYFYISRSHFRSQSRSRVDPGDIVMAKIGAQAGMCAVLPESHTPAILAGNSLKITADNSAFHRDLLVAYLHRLYERTHMSSIRTETAQPAIGLTRLKSLLVPVPPIAEQEMMVDRLEVFQARLALEKRTLLKLFTKKTGLMDDLLTGSVRVTPLLQSAERVTA